MTAVSITNFPEVRPMAKRPLALRPVSEEERAELDALYRRTDKPRLRTRAQMVLLAIEQKLCAPKIAPLVRTCDETVRNWIKRFNAEGVEGLKDRPSPREPIKVTPEYRERLLSAVRQRPRALGRPYSLWTLQRLADFLAEETGIRLSHEGVRLALKREDIKMSRPQHKITSPDPEYELKKRQ